MCDGIDNDCDGEIDEDYEGIGKECGGSSPNSACYGGEYVCGADMASVVCSTMAPSDESLDGNSADMRSLERCNGIDDDCNGIIDDIYGENSGLLCLCYNGEHKPGEVEEVCNGIDDDCDGLIDEGLGNCACSDIAINNENAEAIWAMIESMKASEEVCNNIDDNCNGEIDEGLGDSCFCTGGYDGEALGRPEFCNGVDDNCDGIIDNVPREETCACSGNGAKPGENEEVCNDIDDNCNGIIDEKWVEKGSACGIGACAGGMYICNADGDGTICSSEANKIPDADERNYCDGIDNNCNAAIDEGCKINVSELFGNAPPPAQINRTCGISTGECSEGIQIAIGGRWGPCMSIGEYKLTLPSLEICDGIDNDCDGIVDNIGGKTSVEETQCACYGGASPSEEICDGIDNDCDGTIDNVGGGDSVESTQCGCYDNAYAKGAGLEICDGIDNDCDGIIDNVKEEDGIEETQCACYGGASPSEEICDGIDNDCDGEIDEGFRNVGDRCGTGYCSGFYECSPDGKSVVCIGKDPETEICDLIDNDCDGQIDEGCYGSEISSCENGIKDGSEEGVDCGGECPTPCIKEKEESKKQKTNATTDAGETVREIMKSSWFTVFVIIVALIIGVVLALYINMRIENKKKLKGAEGDENSYI